jgi:trimeric autotransporter adhesin
MGRLISILSILVCLSSNSLAVDSGQGKSSNPGLATAVIEKTITYQGILKNSTGNPVPDNTYNIIFRIYDVSAGGSALWNSGSVPIITSNGYFTKELGPIALPFDRPYYLSIQVSPDVEMANRQKITMSPYSASSDTANYAFASAGGSSLWNVSNSLLSTNNYWGIAKGNAGNALLGDSIKTMVNLGAFSQTGYSSGSRIYPTIGGGIANQARGNYSTIAGGNSNIAYAPGGTVGGGAYNEAYANYSGVAAGDSNSAGNGTTDDGAFVGGGAKNIINGKYSATVGGYSNNSTNWYDFIGGGLTNRVTGYAGVVGGGVTDTVTGDYGVVVSGYANKAGYTYADTAAFVGGGSGNTAAGDYSAVLGGQDNLSGNRWSTVCGGHDNIAAGQYSFIGTGYSDTASAAGSFICGGYLNNATGLWSIIGSGSSNKTGGQEGAILSGDGNYASGDNSFIGNGWHNNASGWTGTVVNGSGNRAYGDFSFVGNGLTDTAGGKNSFVGAGENNRAKSLDDFIGSGYNNLVTDTNSAIVGGSYNTITSRISFIGGGTGNQIIDQTGCFIGGGGLNSIETNADYSFIGGGFNNHIYGNAGVINGGDVNEIRGDNSVILGGTHDTIDTYGFMSMAFGWGVYHNDDYRIVFYDSTHAGSLNINRDSRDATPTSYPIQVGTNPRTGNGAYLTPGGVWTGSSSRTFKENFTPFNGSELLSKIANLSITSYNYKNSTEKHVGPVAEEFVGAFDTGVIRESDGKRDNQYLAASDVAGVALAGVQEIIKQNRELKTENENMKTKIDDLERRLSELERNR